MDVPADLQYSVEHEWIADGDGTVGITAFAVEQIGDIVFVELPAVGTMVDAAKPFGAIESVKAVERTLRARSSGTIIAVNDALPTRPRPISIRLLRRRLARQDRALESVGLAALKDAAAYQALIASH